MAKGRKEINLTKDSVLALLQEVYNELVEQRNTAIRMQNKLIGMMKTAEDMTVLGPVIEKQQKIINDCVDKKLQLGKLQSGLWEKTQNTSDNFTLTEMDDDLLQSLIMKDVEKGSNDSVKYNL
jgi:hypothetical protein